jgi:hypothetical protein
VEEKVDGDNSEAKAFDFLVKYPEDAVAMMQVSKRGIRCGCARRCDRYNGCAGELPTDVLQVHQQGREVPADGACGEFVAHFVGALVSRLT